MILLVLHALICKMGVKILQEPPYAAPQGYVHTTNTLMYNL